MFNWFSPKSGSSKALKPDGLRAPAHKTLSEACEASAVKLVASLDAQAGERKVKRHARREQLYAVIRECMTRAGVLSASYKFKVLSLDHRGNQFLVMMDVAASMGGPSEKLSDIETLLVSTAKSRFNIDVTAVYWRTDGQSLASSTVDLGVSQGPALKPAGRFEPINDDEVAAFKQALVAASQRQPILHDGVGKTRSGLRSYTLITGFEDTEVSESSEAPTLSTTQYGDLR